VRACSDEREDAVKLSRNADNVFFTGDTHFGHRNIIDYCSRPYESVDEMNECLIKNWNDKVGPDDTVFHLGDFAMGNRKLVPEYKRRLNGEIWLIRGNHDSPDTLRCFHEPVIDLMELNIKTGEKKKGQKIILCHYRFDVWDASHRGAWHVHGHSHGTLPIRKDRKVWDVGVDANDYQPVSFWDLKRIMDGHGQETVDHHGRDDRY
jgi:calcineurin-like phosphoesterase family protein